MTHKQTKHIIEVEQAYVDGKEIEENWGVGWHLTANPSWEWQRCDYRVKPTPNREYELEQLLRSACAIAERKGEDTHWENFINSAKALGINGVTARYYRIPKD